MKFNALATIQTFTETPNDYGEPVKSWNDGDQIYGWMVNTGGSEKAQKYGLEHVAALTFRAYWRDTLTTRDRLKIDGAIYEIEDIARDAAAVVYMNLKLKATDGRE